MINKDRYGCSTARNKATCENKLSIRKDMLEQAVLGGLRDNLMQPEAYQAFVEEFTREFNRQSGEQEHQNKLDKQELEQIESNIRRGLDAINSGVAPEIVKDELNALAARRKSVRAKLETAPPVRPRLHPNLSLLYKEKITNLIEALNAPETIAEANGAIRQLIEAVRLVPKGESLQIELFGELAALLKLSEEPKTKHPLAETEGVQVTMVAGAGFEPTTFGL